MDIENKIKNEDNNFNVNHEITLYDYDKETEIFTIEIDYDGKIDTIDFSNDLLEIGNETHKLPLDKTFYQVIKFDNDKYYLDFKK